MAALNNHLLLAQGESSPYLSGATFAEVFVLIYWLREFSLPSVANRFELRCALKGIDIAILTSCYK